MRKIHLFLTVAAAAVLAIAEAGCSASAKKTYHAKRGDRYFNSGQLSQAEVEYIAVLHNDPQNPHAIGRLGEIYFDEGRYQHAAPFLAKGVQLDTNNPDLHIDIGKIYLAVGKEKEARNEADFVLQHNPRNAEAPLLLAKSVPQKDIADARRQLQNLTHAGDTASLETALGTLALREHDLKNAELDFRRALSLDAQSAPAYAGLGSLYQAQQNLPKAEDAFKSAADASPPRSPERLEFAQFELQTGNPDKAKVLFTQMTKDAPDFVPGWIGLAETALAEKKYDDCDAALKQALARDSDNFGARLFGARLDMARGDTTNAESDLKELAKKYPQAPGVHYQLALACLANSETDKALNELHVAVNLNNQFADAVNLLAEIEIKTGDTASAVDLLRTFVSRHPKSAESELLLADAYRVQGQFTSALEIYQDLEKSFPKNPRIPLLMGSTFVEQQDDANARKEFNHALQIAPDNITAQEQLAELDLAEHHFTTAEQRAQTLIQKNSRLSDPHVLLAKIYLAQGETNRTEAELSNAVKLQPDNALAYLLLAQLRSDAGQNQSALDALNEALKKNPKSTAALMLIGDIRTAQKNDSAAEDAYEKVLAINPRFAPALDNLACLYVKNPAQLDRAYKLAQRARQLLPNDPSIADTLGWVLVKKGQYLPAMKLLQDAAGQLPNQPEVQFHLGMAHYLLGDESDAREAFQRALQSGKEFSGSDTCHQCLAILAIDPKTADAAARTTLEKQIADTPDDPVALSRLVAIDQRDKQPAKAVAACEAALKADPQSVPAMVLLAQLDAGSNPQKAFSLAKSAYKLKPDDADVAHILGRTAFLNGNYQWSFNLLRDLAQNQPDNPETLYDYAQSAFSMGKITDAKTAMQNALQSGLSEPRAGKAKKFLELIALYENPEQAVSVESGVGDFLAANPNNPAGLLVAAVIDTQKGDPLGAEEDYQKILNRYPDFAPAQKNLAILYAQNFADPQKAYPLAAKAHEAFPDDPDVSRALGLIVFQEGNYARAARLLQTISHSKSADAELFYCLGISEFHLKNFTDSRTSLRRALDLNLTGQQAADARQTLAELK